jgi:ABC-type molybdate transport system permease subunit
MNPPPVIPPSPPTIPGHSPRASFAKQAATFSLLAPFVGMGVNIFTQLGAREHPIALAIVGGTAVLLILAGFVLGIVALVQMKKYGKQGIFWKAIAGICINGLLIAAMLISIPGLKKAAERAKEMQRQKLQQQQ